jgi:hypothetical protein
MSCLQIPSHQRLGIQHMGGRPKQDQSQKPGTCSHPGRLWVSPCPVPDSSPTTPGRMGSWKDPCQTWGDCVMRQSPATARIELGTSSRPPFLFKNDNLVPPPSWKDMSKAPTCPGRGCGCQHLLILLGNLV